MGPGPKPSFRKPKEHHMPEPQAGIRTLHQTNGPLLRQQRIWRGRCSFLRRKRRRSSHRILQPKIHSYGTKTLLQPGTGNPELPGCIGKNQVLHRLWMRNYSPHRCKGSDLAHCLVQSINQPQAVPHGSKTPAISHQIENHVRQT